MSSETERPARHKQGEIEGVQLKELRTFQDDRGFFREAMKITDGLFEEGLDCLSHTTLIAGKTHGWYVRADGCGWWYLPQGVARVRLYDRRPDSVSFGERVELCIGENELAGVIRIPAGVVYGFQAEQTSNLVYVTDRAGSEGGEQLAVSDGLVEYDW